MASGIDISLENVALKITKKDDIYTIDTKSGKNSNKIYTHSHTSL